MPDDKPQPTIDERLQAVIMTLELGSRDIEDLKALTRQNSQDIQALAAEVRALADVVRQDGDDIRALTALVHQDAENIRALARIAEIHEHRLSGLEE
jgi:archaellum component FlaC